MPVLVCVHLLPKHLVLNNHFLNLGFAHQFLLKKTLVCFRCRNKNQRLRPRLVHRQQVLKVSVQTPTNKVKIHLPPHHLLPQVTNRRKKLLFLVHHPSGWWTPITCCTGCTTYKESMCSEILFHSQRKDLWSSVWFRCAGFHHPNDRWDPRGRKSLST